jgi:hypothetical protein
VSQTCGTTPGARSEYKNNESSVCKNGSLNIPFSSRGSFDDSCTEQVQRPYPHCKATNTRPCFCLTTFSKECDVTGLSRESGRCSVLNTVGRNTLLEMENINVLFGRTYNDGGDDDGDDPKRLYYYYYYLLQLSFHSVAVVLTLVQKRQIRISMHK